MAIDTQEKRMAAASTGRSWMRATFPTGTIDAEERASAGNTYGGNEFVAPSATLLLLPPNKRGNRSLGMKRGIQ